MTAQEAREKAEKVVLNKKDLFISDITTKIDKAVEQGKFSIFLYEVIPDNVLQHFEDLKYTCKVYSNRDMLSSQTKISW